MANQHLLKLQCAVWGHRADHQPRTGGEIHERACRCGATYLPQDGRATHAGHRLACFFGHHTYERLTDRDGCHEYVCVKCGHPLLFQAHHDPYSREARFDKKVRYLCGVFGHRVTAVAERHGRTEYACFCGHSFLLRERGLSVVRHPLRCVVAGHWITYIGSREGFAEYLCQHCGHPFCFRSHAPSGRA